MRTARTLNEQLRQYLVTLRWGADYFAEIELNAFDPGLAARRAVMAGLYQGWYGLEQLHDVVTEVTDEGPTAAVEGV